MPHVVDPDAAIGTVWSDLVISQRDAMASIVRPWDRQRAQGRQTRNHQLAPVARVSARFQPRRGIRSEARIARTISSRRPA